jgi:GT2 family glycosyltransferase
MVPRHDPALPGFVMNAHPGKGQPWRGGSEPVAQRLMTGACLCLRKADYLAAGGLDEGYLVGDFEDSDLCMALRARGLRAWLLPQLRLWHLERQSQNADSVSAQRQLLTLYNAWRYRRRILDGVIADPEAVEA